MEYYSAIKKDEILPFTSMWVELKGIMLSELSEISQSEKDNYHMVSLICGIEEIAQRIIGKGRET